MAMNQGQSLHPDPADEIDEDEDPYMDGEEFDDGIFIYATPFNGKNGETTEVLLKKFFSYIKQKSHTT